MTAEDIMAMKAMSDGTDMSSYEHFKIANDSAKRPSGTSIAAITIGSAALLTGIGAWIFGGVYAAQGAKASQRDIDRLAQLAIAERAERVNYQGAVNKTIIDISSGALAGATSAALAGANSSSNAYSQAEAQIVADRLTGRSQLCPTPVSLYSSPQPCGCPCSCNG